jgi:hypothetical protein
MAQIRAVFSSLFARLRKKAPNCAEDEGDFHERVKEAFRRGRFDALIANAERDYAQGRALETLY